MILKRELLEALELETLAPYAMKARESRGRKYALEESAVRTCYQRDYDRIVHSKAFRRMEYKTQVFVNSEGDHYRTRLTHSMEVAQICRSVARSLRLNTDLAEAVALAHDLGHPPFGHAGEEALNRLLADHGGFNHNVQTLRTIDELESRYPFHPGLNLSYEVREGIARHESAGAVFDQWEFPPGVSPPLEAAIVDTADEIAYNSHDVDDGLASGLIHLKELSDVPICLRALEEAERLQPGVDEALKRYDLVRTLVGWQIHDLVSNIDRTLAREKIDSAASLRNYPGKVAIFSYDMQEDIRGLREFLNERLYQHPRVVSMAQKGAETVTRVFEHLLAHPERMPESFVKRSKENSVATAVRDYVAGMTDRYAERLSLAINGQTEWPNIETS